MDSLETELFKVAKSRLLEHVGEQKGMAGADDALAADKMTFRKAAAVFLERLRTSGPGLRGKRSNRKEVTESTIQYREQTVMALLNRDLNSSYGCPKMVVLNRVLLPVAGRRAPLPSGAG